MANYKAVMFDFDGTLADTNNIILNSWNAAAQKLTGKSVSKEIVLPHFGQILEDAMRQVFPGSDPVAGVAAYKEYQFKIFIDQIELFPGVKEMLQGLKDRNIKIAIVTSRLNETFVPGLTKFYDFDYFDAIISCDDTDAHKPMPEPILLCLKKLGIDKDEAIYVGDARSDILCAHRAGVKACQVDWSICKPDKPIDLESTPDWIINKPEDIYDIL